MKRTTLLLLMVVYLLSCMGMGISRFYCCGKLASVKLTYGAADNSGKDAGKTDCCKHVNQSLKLKDSHVSVAALSLVHPATVLVPAFTLLHNVAIHPAQSIVIYKANAPPRSCVISKYTLNCAYRI